MSTSDIYFSRIPGSKSSKSSGSRTEKLTPFGVPKPFIPPLNGEFQSQSAPIQSNSPGNMIISVSREDLEIHTPKRESSHVKSNISTSSVSYTKPTSLPQAVREHQRRLVGRSAARVTTRCEALTSIASVVAGCAERS